MATLSPVDCVRVEDVAEAHLGGASRFELAAFPTAVLGDLLDAEVPTWTPGAVGRRGAGAPWPAHCSVTVA